MEYEIERKLLDLHADLKSRFVKLEIREQYAFLAGIGIAILAGILANSLYRIIELDFGSKHFLIHLFVINCFFSILIYVVFRIKKNLSYKSDFVMVRNYDWLKKWLTKRYRD